MQTRIERDGPREVAAVIERAKRLTRLGWTVTLLEEIDTGSLVTLAILEPDAEPVPDRTGQFELDVS